MTAPHRVSVFRALLVVGLAATLALSLLLIPPAAAAPRVKLTMFIWAGSNQGVVPREVVARYLRSHPDVEIEFWESNNAVTYPRMIAAKQVDANKPLINFGYFNVDISNRGDTDDMWVSMNPARIPNMTRVHSTARRPGNRGVGYGVSGIGYVYNKNLVKEPPTSWADLWNPKWRGKVTFFDNDFRPLVLAARLNGGSEKNIDPGFKIWADNAKNIRALANSNDQLLNLLVTGEALIAPWFASIWKYWEMDGAPLGFTIPKEGLIAFPIYVQIVKGSTPEQIRVAEEVINELLTAENNGRYGRLTFGIPSVTDAEMSETVRTILNPKLLENAIWLDWTTMGQKTSEWRQRWEREVKSRL